MIHPAQGPYRVDRFHKVLDVNGEPIAQCSSADNAILLSASSDLLEALIFARDEIAMRVKEDGGDAYSVRKACRKMNAAIAKAQGEA